LKLSGLLDIPALFLSGFILGNKNVYYQKLRAVTEKNFWQDWILYMLEMIERTAQKSRSHITQIEKLMSEMGAEIQRQLPKIYSKDLMEVLFRLPYSKRQFLESAGLGNIKTVGNYLIELEKAGFLRSEQVGKEKLYLNFKLLEILVS
jgi:Fic family protein